MAPPRRDPKIVDFNPRRRQGSGGGREPLFNDMPSVVLWLLGLNIGVFVLVWLAGEIGLSGIFVLTDFLVLKATDWYAPGEGVLPRPLQAVISLVGYQFMHADIFHIALNMLMLLALGRPLARVLGSRRFLDFYLLTGAAGGLVFVLINVLGDGGAAVGASGAICGLYGGMIQSIHSGHDGYLRHSERGAANALALLILIQIVFAYFAASSGTPIAWEAHVGGLLAGFLLFPLFWRGFGKGARGPRGGSGSGRGPTLH